MKASSFTLNSDFLSVAQVGGNEYPIYIGAGTLMEGEQTVQEFDFSSASNSGGIDRIMISKDGSNFMFGYYLNFYPTVTEAYWVDSQGTKHYIDGRGYLVAQLIIYRPNPKTLRAKLVMWNNATYATVSYASIAFKVKISSFKVPNVF